MTSTTSSQRRTEKGSSDSSVLSFDLYSILTYMAALATGEPPRDAIFAHATAQDFKTAIFFKQVYLMVKRLGFEYVHAFRLVANQAKADTIKSLLLRFGSALGSGESEIAFMLQDAHIEQEKYEGYYTRKIEALQKWGDAYAAFMVSSTLIVVVALISTMLFEVGSVFLLMMGGMMIPFMGVAAFIIYAAAPYEVTTYQGKAGPPYRRRAKFLFMTLGPVGVAVAGLVSLTGNIGLGFVAFGAAILPAGLYAYLDDRTITKVDQEVASFIRALGNVAASLRTTLTNAVGHLDRRSMEALEPYLYRLEARLNSKISPDICWEQFRDEVGSELLSRTTRMFQDGVAVGAPPDKVGAVASSYALTVAQLRAKRQATAQPFAYLVVPLHVAMTALMAFILQITIAFNDRLQQSLAGVLEKADNLVVPLPNLPIFQPRDLTMASNMVLLVLIVLTVVNSIVPKLATGGHRLKILFFLPIMSIATGISLLVIPGIAQKLLSA